jgi:sugar lactone lactonase YvrE
MREKVLRTSIVVVGLCTLAIVFTFSSPGAAQMTPYRTMVEYTGPGEHPVSVVCDKVGNAWVSLQPICQVRQYTPDWQEVARLDLVSDCSGDTGAVGLAVDATGRLYAAVKGSDPAVRGVYEVSPSGGTFRIPGTEQILFPNSIAFDHHNGTMYVTDMVRGAVWRVPRGGAAEVWAEGPVYEGISLFGPRLGANGIAVDRGAVVVSVTFPARVVRIPIEADDSAGAPTVLSLPPNPAANPALLFAIDDVTLDVFGNVFVSAIAVGGVGWVAADQSAVQRFATLPGAVVSLAFGTGMGRQKSLFVAMNPEFGGAFSGIVRIDAGVPGRPFP